MEVYLAIGFCLCSYMNHKVPMRLYNVLKCSAGLTLSTPGDLAISLGTSDTACLLILVELLFRYIINGLVSLPFHMSKNVNSYRYLGLPKNINPVLRAMCYLILWTLRVIW